jgi:hypothetical protein
MVVLCIALFTGVRGSVGSVLKNSPVLAFDPSYDPEIGVFGLLEPTRTPINVSRSSF